MGVAHPNLRVLVVDDDQDNADTLVLLLHLWGLSVRVAYDGPTALEVAKAEPPDVVLLDIAMPGMDGCELARRLRRQPEMEKALLVSISGYGQEIDRQRSREAGCDRHLVKPCEADELERLLRSHHLQLLRR
jgi:two-component system CheB/CheR fusion protein